jgi:hypothetical protein
VSPTPKEVLSALTTLASERRVFSKKSIDKWRSQQSRPA